MEAGHAAIEELAWQALRLHERFRPAVPAGWGGKGVLDLEKIAVLAR